MHYLMKGSCNLKPTPAITRAARRGRTRRPLRIVLWSAAVLVVIALLVCSGISTYVGWQLTHPVRAPINDSPASYQIIYEDVEFRSRKDDILLKGWFMPAAASIEAGDELKPNIIIAHGYEKNRLHDSADVLSLSKELVSRGHHVLTFDFRNSGESEGTLTSVGVYERYDLLGAVDWMKANHPGEIVLLGFSMGATTSLLAAADEPAIAGVIADSPFNHLTRYLEKNLPLWSDLPNFPFTPLIMTIMPRITGFDPNEADALTAVDRIYPRPVLFIHSVDDESIPHTESEAMWAKHPDRFEFWKTSEAGHARNYPHQPQPYLTKIDEFMDKLP